LKDEVLPVDEHTGWVSMPELDKVLSEKNINVERLTAKLTPAIANTNPHLPDGKIFFQDLLNDEDNWECPGTLDKKVFLSQFDKDTYGREIAKIEDEVRQNHAEFLRKFGGQVFASKQTITLFKPTGDETSAASSREAGIEVVMAGGYTAQ